jgi:hypothetical protein
VQHLSRQQLRQLQRYPRAASVWKRRGVHLASTTRVEVVNGQVRIVRQGT